MNNLVIYINCYNKDERFTTLKKAYEKYFEGFIFCEGNEKERYKNVCDNIKNNNYEIIRNEAKQIIAVRYYDNTKKRK